EREAVEAFHEVLRKERLKGGVLVSGGGMGLLGTKLAFEDPEGVLVTVVREGDGFNSGAQIDLNEFLGVENVLLCDGGIDGMVASAIVDAGEGNLFQAHVSGSDVVAGALFDALGGDWGSCEGVEERFSKELGALGGMAWVNYWVIPSVEVLVESLEAVLEGECSAEVQRLGRGEEGMRGIVEAALGGGEGRMVVVDEG
ncbi:hypothetical protein TrRE_jg13450, partial [Triparma retinervis]